MILGQVRIINTTQFLQFRVQITKFKLRLNLFHNFHNYTYITNAVSKPKA